MTETLNYDKSGAPYVCLLLRCVVHVRPSDGKDLLLSIMVDHTAKVRELERQPSARCLVD